MKKFNLFKEIIIVNKGELVKALNTSKVFAINIKGEVLAEPIDNKEILIYKGQHTPAPTSALSPSATPALETMLGKNYQLVVDGERVLVKAFSNWQELIAINTPNASYDDTTADGVADFSNKDLEDIGWQATEFNVNYRNLVELLEDKCEGTILCIEQVEPYQFSGLGFIADDAQAKQIMFEYCQTFIQDKLANDDDFERDDLDDDQEEAAEFFKL